MLRSRLVPLLLLAPQLAALAEPAAPGGLGRFAPPKDISENGFRVTWLFWYTSGLGAFAFTLVVLALVFFALRYRARPGRRAVYDHGTSKGSYAFTGVLALTVFLSIDLVLVHRSREDMEQRIYKWPTAADTVKIEVMPQQWAWNFRYAGPDGAFNTPDDIVTLNDMRIPRGRPIYLQLKAKDVIHSFYVPNIRAKQDANPGSVTKMTFKVFDPGLYEIACSQMCGWAHFKMKGDMRVLTEDDYERWIKDAEGDSARRFDPDDKEALWGWEWQP